MTQTTLQCARGERDEKLLEQEQRRVRLALEKGSKKIEKLNRYWKMLKNKAREDAQRMG